MAETYSVSVCRQLAARFEQAQLHRPMRVDRYDAGTELVYEMTGVLPAHQATVRVKVDKFVGGGFAGQVYRVNVLAVEGAEGPIEGLEVGATLAMKILIPPSGFSLLFRNVVYGVGFQGPFQLQVNPTAARAGALWQKFIRRAAGVRFGDEGCVNDILATFVDSTMGSCGELSYWVEGRTWRLEVEERVDLLKGWRRGKCVDAGQLNSPEYRAKFRFMHEFVKLLHEMGAHEFARQYEWSTCKSQPNCLKRTDSENDPSGGLIAVDFRAGLALLPFLPMSPGDVVLIAKGIGRGSLVQFDRGNIGRLEAFMEAHGEAFSGMEGALAELKQAERVYRDSLPDITHNHVRLLYSRPLWSTMFDSAVTGYEVRNYIDADKVQGFRHSRLKTVLFFLVGLLPLLGRVIRRVWARADYRKHYGAMLGSWDYFRRAVRGRIAEKLVVWHRAGRVSESRAMALADCPGWFWGHLVLSVLPVGLHRFLTDGEFFRAKLAFIFVRPVRLYFNAGMREQWLRDMVAEGQKNHIVTDDDAATILGRINEPFIQKYLKSLAVHVCTLPVTQVVSVFVAIWYKVANQLSWGEAWGEMLFILAVFQVTPISPGSICRGAYVVYLVCKEKNFKDYNIAIFLGFFKYVGYLAFPIQMAYRYPVLARFMAAHWATGAVHIVPVFGEKGALLEHGVFAWFYNWPLTLRRRMAVRAELRRALPARRWHVLPLAVLAAGVFAVIEREAFITGELAFRFNAMWWVAALAACLLGSGITLLAGGASFGRRMVLGILGGVLAGVLASAAHLELNDGVLTAAGKLLSPVGEPIWGVFIFALFTVLGLILTELRLGEPKGRS